MCEDKHTDRSVLVAQWPNSAPGCLLFRFCVPHTDTNTR